VLQPLQQQSEQVAPIPSPAAQTSCMLQTTGSATASSQAAALHTGLQCTRRASLCHCHTHLHPLLRTCRQLLVVSDNPAGGLPRHPCPKPSGTHCAQTVHTVCPLAYLRDKLVKVTERHPSRCTNTVLNRHPSRCTCPAQVPRCCSQQLLYATSLLRMSPISLHFTRLVPSFHRSLVR
jgi:hypothetical protein